MQAAHVLDLMEFKPAPGRQLNGYKRGPEMVYFFRCGPYIKIGWTVNVGQRARGIRTMTPFPLEIVAAVPGGRDLERKMHKRFAAHRHRDEWFHASEELEAFLRELPPYDGPTR